MGACQNVTQGVTDLNAAATDRNTELSSAQGLQVDALPDGDQIKQSLVTALTYSLQADQSFASWAASIDPGTCQPPAPQGPDYAAADSASQQATAAKTQFLTLWQPIAAQYSLPVPAEGDI